MKRIRFSEVSLDALKNLIREHTEIRAFDWTNPPTANWGWDNVPAMAPLSPGATVLDVAAESKSEADALQRLIEEIKNPPVFLHVRKYIDETGKVGVCIEATNKGVEPIPRLRIEWVYGTNPVKRFEFVLPEGEVQRPLNPGEMRIYVFPSARTEEMCSVVQSVSADEYSIRATKGQLEELAIPGAEWGQFIESVF